MFRKSLTFIVLTTITWAAAAVDPGTDSWFINSSACPVQLSLKEIFHGVVSNNQSNGMVVRYQLACFEANKDRFRITKRLEFLSQEIPNGHFVMLDEEQYASARTICGSMTAKVGIVQVDFSDGSVWLASANLRPVRQGSH